MHVLVVSPQPTDQREIGRLVASAGAGVTVARDARAGTVILSRESFDAVIVDASLGVSAVRETVVAVRRREHESYTFVAALASTPSTATVAALFKVGVDDVLRRPVCVEDLVGQLAAFDRIKRWAWRLASTGGVARDWSKGTNVEQLRAWNDAVHVVGAELSALLGHDVKTGGAVAPLNGGLSALAPLTLAAEGVDVCVLVSLDETHVEGLAEVTLGGPTSRGALGDVMREIANSAAGALRRAAELEGVTLTMGVSTDVPAEERADQQGTPERGFRVAFEDRNLELEVRLFVRPRGTQRLHPARLNEGMVLARDLVADTGTLLLPCGTRLSVAAIARLQEILAPTMVVDVTRSD